MLRIRAHFGGESPPRGLPSSRKVRSLLLSREPAIGMNHINVGDLGVGVRATPLAARLGVEWKF